MERDSLNNKELINTMMVLVSNPMIFANLNPVFSCSLLGQYQDLIKENSLKDEERSSVKYYLRLLTLFSTLYGEGGLKNPSDLNIREQLEDFALAAEKMRQDHWEALVPHFDFIQDRVTMFNSMADKLFKKKFSDLVICELNPENSSEDIKYFKALLAAANNKDMDLKFERTPKLGEKGGKVLIYLKGEDETNSLHIVFENINTDVYNLLKNKEKVSKETFYYLVTGENY